MSVSVKIETVVKDRQASIDPFCVRVRVRIRDESRSEQFITDMDFNTCTQSKFYLYSVLVVLVSISIHLNPSTMPKCREGSVRLTKAETCESLCELVRKNPAIYDAKSHLQRDSVYTENV